MRHLDGGYANANPTAKAVATGHGVAKYATNFSVSSLTKSGYARARVFLPDAPRSSPCVVRFLELRTAPLQIPTQQKLCLVLRS
jgi:hypothetical protein